MSLYKFSTATETTVPAEKVGSPELADKRGFRGAVGLTLPALFDRPRGGNPYVFYICLFLFFFAWPVWFTLAAISIPFAVPLLALRLALNILRASDWKMFRSIKLCGVIVSHFWGIVSVLPLMSTVLWYYYIRSKRDGVTRDIPFATCPYGGSGTSSAGASTNAAAGARGASAGSASSRTSTPSSSAPSSRSGSFVRGSSFSSSPTARASAPGLSATGDICIADMRLDVFATPRHTNVASQRDSRPVLIFVYGGGWGTGSKAYYSKLAAMLRNTCDAVVVVPDYPLYPKAGISTMVDALFHVVRWTYGNITRYGGDPHRLYIAGHSAGAHLAMMLLLRRALALSNDRPCPLPRGCMTPVPCRDPVPLFGLISSKGATPMHPSPNVSSPVDYRQLPVISGLVLLSGVYDLSYHLAFEFNRGVDRVSCMEAATGGFWDALSPTIVLNSMNPTPLTPPSPSDASSQVSTVAGSDGGEGAGMTPPSSRSATITRKELARFTRTDDKIHIDPLFLPPITLAHSASDSVVDVQQSMGLRDALRRHNISCTNVQLLNCGHSGIVLDPVQQERDGVSRIHPTVATIAAAMH